MKSFTAFAITAALVCVASANPYKEYHDGEDIFGEDIDNIGLGGPNDPLQIFSGRPDIQIETRPPVVLITTVTRVVEMAELLPTGTPNLNPNVVPNVNPNVTPDLNQDGDSAEQEEILLEKKYGKYHKYGGSENIADESIHADGVSSGEASVEGEVSAADVNVDADNVSVGTEADAPVDVVADVDADVGAANADPSALDENLQAAQATSGSASPTASASSAARTSSIASKVSSAVHSASASAKASASAGDNLRVGGTFVCAAAGIAAYLLL